MMAMVILRACLTRIGHYGGLDIASPQSGNTRGQACLPHISEVSAERSRDIFRFDILL